MLDYVDKRICIQSKDYYNIIKGAIYSQTFKNIDWVVIHAKKNGNYHSTYDKDGKILSTGGVHEPEFFQKFFSGMNQGLFLDQNQ